MREIILASASPRRRDILNGLGVSFTVLAADTDENCTLTDPAAYAEELARRKGRAVYDRLKARGNAHDDTVILSADTVVCVDGVILGKPHDEADACRMLRALSGKTHAVITGIGLTVNGVTVTASEKTLVHVAQIPDGELKKYAASGDPLDKAGAYGIQGAFSKWIEGIDGCYFNVVGLPTHRLNELFFTCTGEYLE